MSITGSRPHAPRAPSCVTANIPYALVVDPLLWGVVMVFLAVYFSFVMKALWRSKISVTDSIFTARIFELLCISATCPQNSTGDFLPTRRAPTRRRCITFESSRCARGLVSHTRTCYDFTTCLGRKIYSHLNFLDLRRQGELILNMDELG